MQQNNPTMEELVSLCKRRGFVFPGSDIYGGLANTWDYGPLGAQLKMNLKSHWWKTFVEQRADMVGLDGSILMNPRVWKASGHVDTFHDPLVECKMCHKRFRADHLLEDKGIEPKYMHEKPMSEHDINCPSCDGELTAPKEFNLMFKTAIGVSDETSEDVYLRPETAQAIFVNFANVLDTSRKRLPFGIAQIGKAFRNEITPGNFTFRTLEFEQMEVEYFIEEKDWEETFDHWAVFMEEWAKRIGLDEARVHRLEIPAEEAAHYSKRTLDFEFDFPFGKKELWGLAYRTDFDLTNHQEHSGQKLEYTDPIDQSRKIVPHVVEPSMGVDRTLLALLLSAYTVEEVGEGDKKDTRVVMKFAPSMAPYKAAVLPLSKKPELSEPARALHERLLKSFAVEYDETQSIGKRYRRQDEIGTPFCITFDFDSLEDQAVTIRDRDTMKQERVKIQELEAYLAERIEDC